MKKNIRVFARKAIGTTLHKSSLDDWFVSRQRISGATILMYHSVTDENNRDWIDPSVSIPSTIFQQHVNFLRKHRNVVRLSDLVDMIEAGHTPPAGTVVVTFDDAYLDTLRVAAPILHDSNLPASVFVISDWVETRPAPWVDVLYNAFRLRSRDTLTLNGTSHRLNTHKNARKLRQRLVGQFVNLDPTLRDEMLEDICDQLRPTEPTPNLLMTWDDIEAWLNYNPGFEIGAHTRNHGALTKLSDDMVKAEVMGSVDELKRRFGLERPHFTYPYGRADERTKSILKTMPVRSAIATEPMKLVSADSDPFDLSRVDANVGLSQLGFLTSGAYPAVKHAVKQRIRPNRLDTHKHDDKVFEADSTRA